ADERIVAMVGFDLDDIDAAYAELDARYLAGEAAAHSHAWSVIANANAAFNRREMFATTPDWVSVDHRPVTGFAPGDMTAYVHATWDVAPDMKNRLLAVHRLTDLGAVITQTTRGTSQEGFEAEWQEIALLTVEGDSFNRCEVFDETDLDAALARFEELHPRAQRLENAAGRILERYQACFSARDWAAMAELLADGMVLDDRRRVVNAGIRRGRDVYIADNQAAVEVGAGTISLSVVATRGERLALAHARAFNMGSAPGEVGAEWCGIAEIDADERIVAFVSFDSDDIDAAFAELDARYLAGEAAAHAHFWSVIINGYDTLNKHELPAVTSKWVTIDHRMRATFEAADQTAYIRGAWDLTPNLKMYIEAVHGLSDIGAVVTHAAYGATQDGFDAEWRMIGLLVAGDDNINRCELFDETDLDTALAKFEELQPPQRRLENAASQVDQRFWTYFATRDWDAMTELTAFDISTDDRRRVVNAGVQQGRDGHMAEIRAAAEVGFEKIESTALATRGASLALTRIRVWNRGMKPEEVGIEVLNIVEIDSGERIVAHVEYDVDEIDAAFEELDARYLAGEAAEHAHAWSVIAQTYAMFNQHVLPAMDLVTIDHRRGTPFAPGDLTAAMRVSRDLTPDLTIYIEAVHRLSNIGAVITNTADGTSKEGFDAEWRTIQLLTVEGDRINNLEIFDEADLDAALEKFDELQPVTPRLENAASSAVERFWTCFEARDWDAMAETWADDYCTHDRRRVVNAGVLRGRAAHLKNMRAVAEVGFEHITSTVVAIRGQRLALIRIRSSMRGSPPGEVSADMPSIVEIDRDGRLAAAVHFDSDDIDAAFAELDARYLAGEAAEHAHAWSVIAALYAGFNRHELPATTPGWSFIDHRTVISVEAGDLPTFIGATLDQLPVISIHMEMVHRLSDLGAVVTHTARGISDEDFGAEWRMIDIFTVEGDLISRCEMFDEADLDAALARFDELDRPAPSFGNAATQTWARVADAFNRRDADALLALASAEGRYEDRRKGLRNVLVGSERRKAVHALFETMPSSWRLELEFIAIRGSRLSLTRERYRDVDDINRPITSEILRVVKVDDGALMQDAISFDPEDINDAFAELTGRWIASGEVAYPKIIESVDRINATINRHDWDAAATHFAGAEYANRRQLPHAANGTVADWLSSMQTTGSLVPDLRLELAEVLARSAIGIVGRMTPKGTPTDGAAIENPFVVLIVLDGERATRLEVFDEDQRDMALARLEELNRPV
ncbi:nuclear transport factor 2 family protein, partial [Mycobacterium sp.]|uniref:nuclear transport factor 2 family protein n=1 Tax=Mycobacterium sp. TaxID=1785 RepID=UPI003BAFA677